MSPIVKLQLFVLAPLVTDQPFATFIPLPPPFHNFTITSETIMQPNCNLQIDDLQISHDLPVHCPTKEIWKALYLGGWLVGWLVGCTQRFSRQEQACLVRED